MALITSIGWRSHAEHSVYWQAVQEYAAGNNGFEQQGLEADMTERTTMELAQRKCGGHTGLRDDEFLSRGWCHSLMSVYRQTGAEDGGSVDDTAPPSNTCAAQRCHDTVISGVKPACTCSDSSITQATFRS